MSRDAGPGCAEESIVVRFDGEYTPEIRSIRNRVFTDEQHIEERMDFDGQDPDAVHVLVACGGEYQVR